MTPLPVVFAGNQPVQPSSLFDIQFAALLQHFAQGSEPTLADLRANTVTSVPVAFVEGYAAPGDGGGGAFVLDPSDSTSVDNGVTVIVDAAAQRWKAVFWGGIDARRAGLKANGVDDDSDALDRVIAAVTQTTLSGVPKHWSILLPPGNIRITRPFRLKNAAWDNAYVVSGQGPENTCIVADFLATSSGPTITLGSTGGGTGAVLVPVIDNGVLTAVLLPAGGTGTGYGGGTTATLTAATGSGATIGLTIAAGIITAAAVLTGGSGYPAKDDGDAVVFKGQNCTLENLSVTASASRQAGGNGGTGAYPYDNYNNGVSGVPSHSFSTTQPLNALRNVWSYGHPGHDVVFARAEQLDADRVLVRDGKADGFILHDDRLSIGINNTVSGLRTSNNGWRGVTSLKQINSRIDAPVALSNLAAVSLPSGVLEELYTDGRGTQITQPDIERNDGALGGFRLITLTDRAHEVRGGFFRGGAEQVRCAAAVSPSIIGTQHLGNAGDPTASGIVFDSTTVLPNSGQNIVLSNVTSLYSTDPACKLATGEQFGETRIAGLRGGQYTSSQAAAFTPDPLTNGRDQYLTLTGAVAIANPAAAVNGRELWLILIQDGTGGWAPTFGGQYAVAAVGSGTADQIYVLKLKCIVTGARTIWAQTNTGAVWA